MKNAILNVIRLVVLGVIVMIIGYSIEQQEIKTGPFEFWHCLLFFVFGLALELDWIVHWFTRKTKIKLQISTLILSIFLFFLAIYPLLYMLPFVEFTPGSLERGLRVLTSLFAVSSGVLLVKSLQLKRID